MSRPVWPICVKCQREYQTKKSGIFVELMADFGSYQLFHADLLECPDCKNQIVNGYGQRAIRNHYEEDYEEFLAKTKTYKCY